MQNIRDMHVITDMGTWYTGQILEIENEIKIYSYPSRILTFICSVPRVRNR